MEILFENKDNAYVAEFEAAGDFNLHIEGVEEGKVKVFQRGASAGGYSFVRGATPDISYGNVYDRDFSAVVYPKYIKVECATQPTMSEVTFNA